jgi:glycine/D-amino acid oxidase-like deaminating enzyme
VTTSAVVVGAGIAGATVAFGLARRGVAVTVVDAELDGRATAAGAGIIQPWSSAASGPYYELYARGAAHHPTLVAQLDELGITDVGYRRCGSLVVADGPAAIDAVGARLRERRSTAPAMGEVERLDGRAIRSHFPPLRDDLHGLVVPGGARVDGRLLVAGVLGAVERLGGTVRRGTVDVRPAAADGVAVTIDDEPVRGDVVVVCGGAWTRPLLAPLGATIDVEPQRGQIVHLHLTGVDTAAWPTVVPVGEHYLVPFDGGRIVAGATRETGSGFDARVTAGGLRQVLDAALALAPGLADAALIEVRVGLRPLATGMVPTVGPIPGRAGTYVATGYGAAGLTMAPVLGDALAELIVTGRSPFALPAGALTPPPA